VLALLAALLPSAAAEPVDDALRRGLGDLDRVPLRTGILYDRVLPLAGLARFDGTPAAIPCDLRTLRQATYELTRASRGGLKLPPPAALAPRPSRRDEPIAIVVLDVEYERLRPGALDSGAGRAVPADAVETAHAFLAAPRVGRVRHGDAVSFAIGSGDLLGNAPEPVERIEIDPGDGGGFRRAAIGEPVAAGYATPGEKQVRVRLTRAGGATREAAFVLDVAALAAALPDDTLHVTASEPWQGRYGSGRAYVRYGRGRSSLANPVVMVEGFDLDDTMRWDELYALLNQEGLADTLWARGYDAVVLDFDEATAPIQENGLLAAELIRQVADALPPGGSMVVVGASMGGLCSRYALAHLEISNQTPPVRTWLSFDTPHLGANLPLGIQHWMEFFSGQSADAAYLLSRLDTPAARQMLLYHHSVPNTAPGQDPQRAAFLADLAAVGDWPVAPRRVAVANGSGTGTGQGFAPGEQIVRWEYSSLLVTITGNVWALPDHSPQTDVFRGRLRILFSDSQRAIPVSGTGPYDNAPGGWRPTMTQMDTSAAPYGDIVALHPAHCFIPTVSAIALPGAPPFTPVHGNPDVPAATPFAAVHVPAANEEHVAITPANAAFVLAEIERAALAAPVAGPGARPVVAVAPQPVREAAAIELTLASASPVRLEVLDVAGRVVRRLLETSLPAGTHRVPWNGAGDAGGTLPPGLYFARLHAGGTAATARIVRVQ
jgi:hypothetical protein